MEKPLASSDLDMLRQKGLLEENEVALLVGDVIVAENVISKARRVIQTSGLLLESTKQILTD